MQNSITAHYASMEKRSRERSILLNVHVESKNLKEKELIIELETDFIGYMASWH